MRTIHDLPVTKTAENCDTFLSVTSRELVTIFNVDEGDVLLCRAGLITTLVRNDTSTVQADYDAGSNNFTVYIW